jgi:serine/threonine protein kinase
VHGDLKPANFVFVKGRLKLIDFGIAKAIGNDTTNIMRESQVRGPSKCSAATTSSDALTGDTLACTRHQPPYQPSMSWPP